MATTATDADLVRRYLAGEQRALGDIYERYGDRVYDLCFAMLNSADDAADAYQDTFLTAANKLDQLRDTERLRSWLYSVARNQCRARLRARKRSTPDEDAGVDVGVDVDMTAEVARSELRELMAEASAGLNDRDREVLELHMRHDLEGEELADALGVSVQNAYKLVQRVRDRVERSLGSLLVARHARRDCDELDQLLEGWDGQFSPLMRKRISRHVDECETCSRRRSGLMDPGGLAGAMPLRSVPADLKASVAATLAAGHAPAHDITRWNRDGFPAQPRRLPKALLTIVALGTILIGGLVGGLAIAESLDDGNTRVEVTAPAPTTSTTAAPTTTTTTTTTEPVTTTTEPRAPLPTTTAAPTTVAPPETTAPPTTAAPTTPTTSPPTTPPTSPPTTPPTTPPTSPPTTPPDTTAPVIVRATSSPGAINEPGPGTCTDTTLTITVEVTDAVGVTLVEGQWTDPVGGNSGSFTLSPLTGDSWRGTVQFPIGTALTFGVPIDLSVWADDAAANRSAPATPPAVTLSPCF